MDGWRFALYLLVMAGVTYLIRMLPFVLFRKRVENRFILSALYYAPFAVLGAMTFPDSLYATGNVLSAAAGLAAAFAAAWRGRSMVLVAALGSLTAIGVELLQSVL